MIHTVILDLDGTLSDSAILTLEAFKIIAPEYDLPVPTKDAIRKVMGHAVPEFYYLLFPDFPAGKVLKAGELVNQEEQRLLPSLAGRLLFERCHELLIRLKESGVHLHIASTGSKDHVFSVLAGTGIMDFFDTINCGRPDKAQMLREITVNCDKTQCIMVGDMKKDYEAARANGIVSVGACYGYCVPELTNFDFYINTPLDLLDMLGV